MLPVCFCVCVTCVYYLCATQVLPVYFCVCVTCVYFCVCVTCVFFCVLPLYFVCYLHACVTCALPVYSLSRRSSVCRAWPALSASRMAEGLWGSDGHTCTQVTSHNCRRGICSCFWSTQFYTGAVTMTMKAPRLTSILIGCELQLYHRKYFIIIY